LTPMSPLTCADRVFGHRSPATSPAPAIGSGVCDPPNRT
jgi:hypothetical protein